MADGLPVSTTISSYFGNRKDPFTGVASNHSGTDIAANDGSVGTINIIAAKEGTVIYPAAGDVTSCPSNSNLDICGGGYGNYVMIEHGDGTITLYGHMAANSITVTAGNPVMQGQVIGKMGSSGRSTGSHLHFEVRVNGSKVRIFENSIPMSVRAAEISAEGVSIYEHDPNGKVASAYQSLTEEVLADE